MSLEMDEIGRFVRSFFRFLSICVCCKYCCDDVIDVVLVIIVAVTWGLTEYWEGLKNSE